MIANGDITTPEKARQVLDLTGADGLMIGRGALGRPWIFDEIRERFAALSFHAGGRTFSVSLSAGISQTDGQSSGGELLERADQGLYLAKHQGRNQVQIAVQP